MYVAPMLSHHSVGDGKTVWSSRRREVIQSKSEVALAIALYSASVLDRANGRIKLRYYKAPTSRR